MSQSCSPLAGQMILSQLSLGETIGVSYLGVALSAMTYGVTLCQMFYYFRSEKAQHDAWFLKALVICLMLVSTVQEALIMHSVYYYVIMNFANPCTLVGKVIWSIPVEVLLNSVISFGVEGFLVHRIWKLGHNIYITTFCMVLLIVRSVVTVVYPVLLLGYPGDVLSALNKFKALGVGALSFAMAEDTTISAILAFYLWRSRTGFRKSDGLITRLMVLTISTGALTSAAVAADMLAYVIAPNTLYIILFNYPLGKMYINVLLTTLNIRAALRAPSGQSTTNGMNSIPLGNISARRPQDARLHVTVDRVIEARKCMADSHTPIVITTPMGNSSDGVDGEV